MIYYYVVIRRNKTDVEGRKNYNCSFAREENVYEGLRIYIIYTPYIYTTIFLWKLL